MDLTNLIITVAVSIVMLFFGLKVEKLAIACGWFAGGYSLAHVILQNMTLNDNVSLIITIVVGLIFALLSFKLQLLSIFVGFFGIGTALVYFSTTHVWYNIVIAVIVGIALGIISVKFYKPALILTTGISSAYIIATSVLQYFSLSNFIYTVLITIVLAALGISFQFSQSKE